MPEIFAVADGVPDDPAAAPAQNYARYPSLVDRTIFVTGGADGIGSAIVEHFARQGSQVAFVDVNLQKAHETIDRCSESSPRHQPTFHHVDVTDIDALQAAIAQAQQDMGSITVLVNNAANDDRHRWDEMTPEYWADRMDTNLRHYFFAIQAAAPAMVGARHGSIVNIGSSSYMRKLDAFPGYAVAKAGIEGLTRTFARTFGGNGVRVNTVLPGWVPTERQLGKWWTAEDEAATLAAQCIPRRIYADEFVQMVLFLASDDGAACTAQQFVVDGGRL